MHFHRGREGDGERDLHRSEWCCIGCKALQWSNDKRGVGLQSLLIATQEALIVSSISVP